MPNADASETAYSRLKDINKGNIRRLGLAWSLDLPGETSLEATPLAVDGVLYFTGSYATVYAVNSSSGKVLWKFSPQTWQYDPSKMGMPVSRGVAYADGRIFSAARDGRLFAFDAKSGKVLWTVQTINKGLPGFISSAPRVFKGKVIIGQSGADAGMRGYVTAYDAASGAQLWRFYTAPGAPGEDTGDPAMERAAATWSGEYWKTGTGGAVWDNITFDAELNQIYLATGNAGPYDPQIRSPGGGDNLYTASIVALDADTGKYRWHYQINPRDSWDFDCTEQMTLANLDVDGTDTKVLFQAPKNGFFYVLNRQTGRLISAEKLGKVTWADHIDLESGRPVEAPDIRYENREVIIWPSPLGAHSFMSQAYSPQTALVYVPYMQLGVRMLKGEPIGGGVYASGLGIKDISGGDAMDGKGALIAWDPAHRKQAWSAPLETIWNGGAMATAGGLVFHGAADGHLYAYDALSGRRLWQFDAQMGIIAAPMTFRVHGKQYISILAGYGGSAAVWGSVADAGWKYREPRRLLTFALDEHRALPPSLPRDTKVEALDDPSLQLNPADVEAGHQLFMRCITCHGRNLVSSGGPGPDLRESPIALNPESLWVVVHDGALMPNGMPRFDKLTHDDVMKIYAYIRAGAREALAQQQTSAVH